MQQVLGIALVKGLIGSWIALVLYAVTAAITKTGILKPVMDKINQPTNVNSDISQTTGIPFWGLVVILTIITIFLVVERSIIRKFELLFQN